MSKVKELREKFEKELEDLQNNCSHEKTSIVPCVSISGGICGEKVEYCLECEKTLRQIPDPSEPQLMLKLA